MSLHSSSYTRMAINSSNNSGNNNNNNLMDSSANSNSNTFFMKDLSLNDSHSDELTVETMPESTATMSQDTISPACDSQTGLQSTTNSSSHRSIRGQHPSKVTNHANNTTTTTTATTRDSQSPNMEPKRHSTGNIDTLLDDSANLLQDLPDPHGSNQNDHGNAINNASVGNLSFQSSSTSQGSASHANNSRQRRGRDSNAKSKSRKSTGSLLAAKKMQVPSRPNFTGGSSVTSKDSRGASTSTANGSNTNNDNPLFYRNKSPVRQRSLRNFVRTSSSNSLTRNTNSNEIHPDSERSRGSRTRVGRPSSSTTSNETMEQVVDTSAMHRSSNGFFPQDSISSMKLNDFGDFGDLDLSLAEDVDDLSNNHANNSPAGPRGRAAARHYGDKPKFIPPPPRKSKYSHHHHHHHHYHHRHNNSPYGSSNNCRDDYFDDDASDTSSLTSASGGGWGVFSSNFSFITSSVSTFVEDRANTFATNAGVIGDLLTNKREFVPVDDEPENPFEGHFHRATGNDNGKKQQYPMCGGSYDFKMPKSTRPSTAWEEYAKNMPAIQEEDEYRKQQQKQHHHQEPAPSKRGLFW